MNEIAAPSIEQLTVEVKFYLGQTAQNILEVGKRLILAKEMLPHGDWQNWLADNFNLSYATAARFMQCSERFGNVATLRDLNYSQMIQLLALPAADTESFIETKAAEGNPVADMTVKQLREEIQQWKSRAEVNDNAVKEKERRISQMALDFNNLQNAKKSVQQQLDAARDQLRKQKPIIQAPADYEQVKRDLAKMRDEKAALLKKLDAAVSKIEIPADYHTNKARLAELDAKIARMQKDIDSHVAAEDYANVAQKLDAIYALISDISNSPNAGRVIDDYERNNPDRYALICAKFKDFMRIMEMR